MSVAMDSDPQFATWAEVDAWMRQRLRCPGPAPDAKIKALEDIRRVTLAHWHLKDQPQ